MKLPEKLILPVAIFLLALAPLRVHSKEIDWTRAPSSRITFFYPGVTSWDFLNSDDHRLGRHDIRLVRKNCRHCHLSKEGELDLKAEEIAAGAIKMKMSHNAFEPEPIAGKKGVIHATIKAAYDKERLYIKVEWESKGIGWQTKKSADSVPDRVSLQINGKEALFAKYGCFISCHNDLYTMPGSPTKEAVKADRYYSKLGRDDVRLYAAYAKSSWSDKKGPKDREEGIKKGGLIDVWSLVLEDGKITPMDGWIYDDRDWEKASDVEGSGNWSAGVYSVVFSRKLQTKDPYDIQLKEGDVFSVGVAIHDDKTAKRKHYVSFPFTIGLGADADLKAVKVSD